MTDWEKRNRVDSFRAVKAYLRNSSRPGPPPNDHNRVLSILFTEVLDDSWKQFVFADTGWFPRAHVKIFVSI